MFCPKCGQQIADDAKFCGFCGTTIENAGAAPQPQGQAPYYNPQNMYGQPYRRPSNIRMDLASILYIVAAGLILLAFIFWWIPSVDAYITKYSLFKVFTMSGAKFVAVLNIIFLIVCLAISAYYCILNQVLKNPLGKFDKQIKLGNIILQLLILYSTMTVLGGASGSGVSVGAPIVFFYIFLIGAICVECVAYFFTEMKKR